ncbi:GNAT family N-acetyltransferase [Sedimentibacter sp. zth1]|uniref:GNAT family N-acetyltransferase n=1 Tax=Sedimentibacter sp. zth1 TaxID=2816908 RepID=UPI001A92608F|nr:GNAT family N-acetyltransferase [Sedimentibacter sp. zth1]QSX06764.1 GNAT family N-acetyltransferase [Sedimentibacter sp. zth1]
MNRKWSKNLKKYDLCDGYSIEQADSKEYSIYFAVYEVFSGNVWFRQSFQMSSSILLDYEGCFWIKKNGYRIGGVLLEPNYMNCLVLEPPYNEYDIIISKLKSLLLCWSDKKQPICVGTVKPDRIEHYQRNGFKAIETRRCMIRPTEEFEINWDNKYRITKVTEESKSDISKLFAESFTDMNEDCEETKLEIQNKSVQFYLDENLENTIVNKASVLIYDNDTNELVGACLISIWEEWPNVYELAVKPSFQNRGLATNMLKFALSSLKKDYPVIRLFVTLGNDAEMVYHKMGFLAGIETIEMILPATD